MTVPDATPEALALAEVLDWSPLRCPHGSPEFCGLCIAQHTLTSDWLARRDARIRAEVLREAARVDARVVTEHVYGEVVAAVTVDDLHNRADRIEAGEQP